MPRSLLSILLIALVLTGFRCANLPAEGKLMVTDWDAFGYYAYLPALALHGDARELRWLPEADAKYRLTGGTLYQANKVANGNYVFKYLGGVALLQSPLFGLAHLVAKGTGYPADGFSPPYQQAIAWGAILYCLLGLLVLRRVLLQYFSDGVTAAVLLLACLATNLIQYTAVDAGMSHVWIFPLYALQLYACMGWHQQPRAGLAFLIGWLIGLATICRPTEAVMLLIPLLWGLQNRVASAQKWALVRANRSHVALALAGGFTGILPQLLYWKWASGAFVYDVGSKWTFLNPHFRVLFGPEKGWFIYTPVALLMVAGLFFMRRAPFRKAVLLFTLLNIWIVIAWDDWRYGGSFSTRALVQSYPVMALPLAAGLAALQGRWLRRAAALLAGYLLLVNLFQTWQYERGFIHYNDMNWRYYRRIYLNPSPPAEAMSLLDSADWPAPYSASLPLLQQPQRSLNFETAGEMVLLDFPMKESFSGSFLQVELLLDSRGKAWAGTLHAVLSSGGLVQRALSIRLQNPVGERTGRYAFYLKVPETFSGGALQLSLQSAAPLQWQLRFLAVRQLRSRGRN